MSRWIPGLLLAGLPLVPMPLAAQDQTTPQTAQQTAPQDTPPNPQLEQRTAPKTSGKQAVPAEEDKSFLSEEHSFNPLQSQKSIEVGDQYFKNGKYPGRGLSLSGRHVVERWQRRGLAEARQGGGKAEGH